MSISESFQIFCSNLRMNNEVVDNIRQRYHRVLRRINIDYWGSGSDSNHGLYVGSYGRGTEIHSSDVDILVQLPYNTYEKFNNYSGNGQSALLQEVKGVLAKTYSSSHLRGDGQVVCIDFSDDISFEILPAFINKDGSYTYPDTNGGGSWKITDPKREIDAINERNSDTNKNLKRLCRMMRSWKENCDVPMSGILIDTLAYRFIGNWAYRDKSYFYYDFMSRDFFAYLKDLDTNQEYWLAPGSNRYVYKDGSFQLKASRAYSKSLDAIAEDNSNFLWREIYGNRFPE